MPCNSGRPAVPEKVAASLMVRLPCSVLMAAMGCTLFVREAGPRDAHCSARPLCGDRLVHLLGDRLSVPTCSEQYEMLACHGATPCPWSHESLRAFVHSHRADMQAIFRRQHAAQQHRLRRFGFNDSRALFVQLRNEGLRYNALGLDFTWLQRALFPERPHAILEYQPVKLSLELLVWPTVAITGVPKDRGLNALIWQHDQVARGKCSWPNGGTHASGVPATLDRLKLQLGREGFLQVENWGLDVVALGRQAKSALSMAKRGGLMRSSDHLAAVEPLLHNETVAELLRDYLGGPVRFDGMVSLYLGDGITRAQYPSHLWHHDRCGRRLKLFIFLHDVASDGRPTQVARGSANTIYFWHSEPWMLSSRYDDSYVQSNFEVVNMTGPRGGGFIFDTNSIHRGVLDGNQARTVVVLEFHGHGKLPAGLGKIHSSRNCPSGPSANRSTLESGWPGFPLYPPENTTRRGNGTMQGKRAAKQRHTARQAERAE